MIGLLVDIVNNETTTSQQALFYNVRSKKLFTFRFYFFNWFFSTKFFPHKEIVKCEKLDNVLLNDGTFESVLYKITYRCNQVISHYKSQKECMLFEDKIPRSMRYSTFYGVRFLEVYEFQTPSTATIRRDLFGKHELEIFLCDVDPQSKVVNKKEVWGITGQELRFIRFEDGLGIPMSKVVVCWRKPHVGPSPTMFLGLQNMCKNFLNVSIEMHAARAKVQPRDYFAMKHQRDFETMKKIFLTHFPRIVFVAQVTPVPLSVLFTVSSKTLLNCYVYLTDAHKHGIVCLSPASLKKKRSFQANPYKVCTPGIYVGDFVCLDWDSMYPSIMIDIFESKPHLQPYRTFLQKMLKAKREEKNPTAKLLLNYVYGCLYPRFQNYIRGCLENAKMVTDRSKTIMELASKKLSGVIYSHTDSFIVPKANVVACDLKDFSTSFGPTMILKVEFEAKKILFINQNARVVYSGKNNDDDDDDVGSCSGLNFNSLSVPTYIRRHLQRMCIWALRQSNTMDEFRKYLDLYYEQQLDLISINDMLDFEELVIIRQNNNRDIVKRIKLIDFMDNSTQEYDYYKALRLIPSGKVEKRPVFEHMFKESTTFLKQYIRNI